MGEHLVSILKDGRHVPNSPISITVVQSEIGDASLVKAHGDGLVQGNTFTNSSFVVDTREAGQFAVLNSSGWLEIREHEDIRSVSWRSLLSVSAPYMYVCFYIHTYL